MPRRKWSSKFHNKRPKTKRKTGKLVPYSARRRHNASRPASSLEQAVYQMLKDERIPFIAEKKISKCHVDVFIEPNIVVELNGCHWHACMVCVKSLTPEQKVGLFLAAAATSLARGREKLP